MRIGNGYDIHRLVPGRRLILGGVELEYDKGLEGHSDADALTHAVIDALLGAAALGDIGQHFPPGDPRFRDANSIDLLIHVVSLLKKHQFVIVNIDSIVICEQPKLAPHIKMMREKVAHACGLPIAAVSVKATTNERLGEIGRGEAIAAQAVVIIRELSADQIGNLNGQ